MLDNFVFSKAEKITRSGAGILIDAGAAALALIVAWTVCSREMKAAITALSIWIIACSAYAVACAMEVDRKAEQAGIAASTVPQQVFSYAKKERNILIMMIDGSMSGFLPDLFRDNPDLKDTMKGFTWYENVVSPGDRTISGMPAMMGGFEYTPTKINGRHEGALADRVSHAYELYPDNFIPKGYRVLYADPFWYGFKRRGDCERLQDETGADCVNLIDAVGRHETDLSIHSNPVRHLGGMMQQYLVLSLFRMSPTVLKPIVYDNANWLGHAFSWRKKEDKFYINYLALTKLTDLSDTNALTPTLTLIVTNVTRANLILNDDCRPLVPEKPPTELLARYGDIETVKIYQTFVCAMRQVGTYLNWLRDEGIWDNTMIVLASD